MLSYPTFHKFRKKKTREMLVEACENYPSLLFSKSNHALEEAF